VTCITLAGSQTRHRPSRKPTSAPPGQRGPEETRDHANTGSANEKPAISVSALAAVKMLWSEPASTPPEKAWRHRSLKVAKDRGVEMAATDFPVSSPEALHGSQI
jgi:hypothetical protein